MPSKDHDELQHVREQLRKQERLRGTVLRARGDLFNREEVEHMMFCLNSSADLLEREIDGQEFSPSIRLQLEDSVKTKRGLAARLRLIIEGEAG